MRNGPPEQGLSPFSHTLSELMKGEVRTIPAEAPAVEAARAMSRSGVGSLVVMEGDEPVGMITRTDLVTRVMEPGKDPAVPVREVLTPRLVSIEMGRPIFDGLLAMIQNGVGHLVLTDGGRLAGVISFRDWLIFQERHPSVLLRRLATAETVAEVAALRQRANRHVWQLFRDEGTADALTRFVTEINDRTTRRVIELSLNSLLAEHGAPPVTFAWIAMGSEGRSEQTLSTDQDNALVFADVPDEETFAVQAWFLRMAARVVDDLEVCGFPRCKGNVMASNPDLCLPLAAWQAKFAGYLQDAGAESLLHAAIYFDFRSLYGEPALVDALRQHLNARISSGRGFLRHMAGLAMVGRPPVNSLSWRLRSLLRLGHLPLDLKRQALAPLVASARVLGLACGSSRTHTLERLHDARVADMLPEDLAGAAESAYDYLMLLRLRQHFGQQEGGEEPSNLLRENSINPLRRSFLADALQIVIDLQDHVFTRFGGVHVI